MDSLTQSQHLIMNFAKSYAARLQATGSETTLATNAVKVGYVATVTDQRGVVGRGEDWSPLRALELAYLDAVKQEKPE